ncbi:hypothetical protein HARCEL1_08120 [Halococcoides cellulosivorans]|uniref:Uncharacterized protein n=1 Tax=Halococcoides cellulosivorans TaxID=1679096 RepID=A0A2R4X1J8_9EURY|nr:hypothetical protein HARCEL1_08120 [Halococcoides cellulosivorans]
MKAGEQGEIEMRSRNANGGAVSSANRLERTERLENDEQCEITAQSADALDDATTVQRVASSIR